MAIIEDCSKICPVCGLKQACYDINFDGKRGLKCDNCKEFTIIPLFNIDVAHKISRINKSIKK